MRAEVRMSVEQAQASLEARFGGPGRSLSVVPDEVLHPEFPKWLQTGDRLYTFLGRRQVDLEQARVVVGRMASSNPRLFKAGSGPYAAEFFFSWDRWFLRRPDRLLALGKAAVDYNQAVRVPRSPSTRLFAERFTTGLERTFGRLVPPLMTEGRRVHHASVVVYPEFLPTGRLHGGDLVALFANVAPAVRQTYLIPHTYWPASLRATWPE